MLNRLKVVPRQQLICIGGAIVIQTIGAENLRGTGDDRMRDDGDLALFPCSSDNFERTVINNIRCNIIYTFCSVFAHDPHVHDSIIYGHMCARNDIIRATKSAHSCACTHIIVRSRYRRRLCGPRSTPTFTHCCRQSSRRQQQRMHNYTMCVCTVRTYTLLLYIYILCVCVQCTR